MLFGVVPRLTPRSARACVLSQNAPARDPPAIRPRLGRKLAIRTLYLSRTFMSPIAISIFA